MKFHSIEIMVCYDNFIEIKKERVYVLIDDKCWNYKHGKTYVRTIRIEIQKE